MATRPDTGKTPARRRTTKPKVAAPASCPVCKGDGTVSVPVMVGRGKQRRQVAAQDGMCLTCLGSGQSDATT
ncbi:hypothetical protein ABZ832_22045 [Streptantibioticus parmotrematis]|uniref:hypothetical protein n=1 Tax=Streptantibioticus parmotrematis TaxID=2873249 RepID=UPI0033E923AD